MKYSISINIRTKYSCQIFSALHSTLISFCMLLKLWVEYFKCAYLVAGNLRGLLQACVFFPWFWMPVNKMAGIVNSGQYCYFSSLCQCLANNLALQHALQEHEDAVRNDPGKCNLYLFHYGLFKWWFKDSTEMNGRKIHEKYSVWKIICFLSLRSFHLQTVQNEEINSLDGHWSAKPSPRQGNDHGSKRSVIDIRCN